MNKREVYYVDTNVWVNGVQQFPKLIKCINPIIMHGVVYFFDAQGTYCELPLSKVIFIGGNGTWNRDY